MAVESIGTLVPTKIPGLSDQADIQAALRAYHYGSYTFNTSETDTANLINPSIAYTITNLQSQITSLSGGSAIQATSFNAKGDLLSASANDTLSVLTVGSNGKILSANSATTTGLEWVTPEVTASSTTTFSNKTLTSPAINTATINNPVVISPEERTTVSATAATGTVNFDAATQGVLYYTTNASANWTLNIRGTSGTTLTSMLSIGDSITVVFLVTNGTTAYYPTAYQIDGVAVTPKWQGGSAPSAGNTSSVDAYSLTIVKTAATPTYTVFGSQTRFA
jgi:hypothetical protein